VEVDGDIHGGSLVVKTGVAEYLNVNGNIDDSLSVFEHWGDGRTDRVSCVGNVSEIDLNTPISEPEPDMNLISVRGDFSPTSPLYFNQLAGLSNTKSDNGGGLHVDGDYSAQIYVSSPLGTENPQIANNKSRFEIGGSFLSGALFEVPTDGLTVQMYINIFNGGGAWESGGDIVVGGVTLGANYTELSSSLGGGQVGEAPFNFHQRTTGPGTESRDCDPYQGEAVTAPYQSGKNVVIPEVRIRHYGPVYAPGTGSHFRVEFKSDVLPSSWVDRTSLFEIGSATATTALAAHRDVVITKTAFNSTGFTSAGRWRIRPLVGKAKCGDVTGNPDVLWDSNVVSGDLGSSSGTQYDWYAFRVFLEAPESSGSGSGSGSVLLQGGTSASDLTSWGVAPYEVNADGEITTQDFTDLVDSYIGN
jgi:hypothetical protein